MKKTSSILVCLFTCILLQAQEKTSDAMDLGIELQWYPAGLMPGVDGAFLIAPHHSLQFRIAYNLANRHDWGKHDNEKGGGMGFTTGYRYYLDPLHQKWFAGIRTDWWWMKIDWKESNTSGQSRITVFQPTLEIGYLFRLGRQYYLAPTIANGFEINIHTRGDAVGQGFISLIGVQAGWRF